MEHNIIEVEIVEQLAEQANLRELSEMQLALVGGGIGDPIAA